MNEQTYKNMLRYSEYSSWALWNPNNIADTSVIDESIAKLQPNIVFAFPNFAGDGVIDLNLSDTKNKGWHNFHTAGSRMDNRLCTLLSNTRYEGAYMTDIMKTHATRNIAELNAAIRNGQVDIEKCVQIFVDELLALDVDTIELWLVGRFSESMYNNYITKGRAYAKIRSKINTSTGPYMIHPSPLAVGNDDTYFQKAREQLHIPGQSIRKYTREELLNLDL